MAGENYYWSKRYPKRTKFHDFMIANDSCYAEYDEEDSRDYSTDFYKDHAIDIINNHDSSIPLFLFLSFQAVHSPFNDLNKFESGIPPEYFTDVNDNTLAMQYKSIMSTVKGRKRRQYAMALVLMDRAVSDVYDALVSTGMDDNAYIIFSSDNGGCYSSGGRNGPLRGTKGSMFEGGVKVDSFIYSPLLATSKSPLVGETYTGLFHISDWMPTILNLTDTENTYIDLLKAKKTTDLYMDGVNQVPGWFSGENQRPYLLYNYYIDVEGYAFDNRVNASLAIRNTQYKLIHEFNNLDYVDWYDYAVEIDNDDQIDGGECSPAFSIASGIYTKYLFDLSVDPYETTNLYSTRYVDIRAA